MKPTIAYIGLGSNMGDRAKTIIRALTMIEEAANVNVALVSQLIETEPVGGPQGQPDYCNAVAEIRCLLSADGLLRLLQSVEDCLGRERREKWGPRTIDLDLLLFGDEIINEPHLQVPHPLMHERPFVMLGLAELAPELRHPILGKTMRQILDALEGP